MEPSHLHHANTSELHKKSPAVLLLPRSLKATPDPVPFNEDTKNKVNNVGTNGGDELESVRVNNATNDQKQNKVVTTMAIDENTNPIMMTQALNTEDIAGGDQNKKTNSIPKPQPSLSKTGEVPNPSKRFPFKKYFQKGKFDIEMSSSKVEVLYQKEYNNNNNCNEQDFIWDSKAAYLEKFLDGNSDRKRNRLGYTYYGDFKDFRLHAPWKRIAYIAMLLVVGLSCAILGLMKVCGGADWMNTATFSVIIMGAVLLLPPGLYYGHIVLCICCQCKGYTLWDVPHGPFG